MCARIGRFLCILVVAVGPGCKGCKGGFAAGDGGAPSPIAELVNRRVPGSPLELRVPDDWAFDFVDAGPEPAAPDGGTAADDDSSLSAPAREIALSSRTLLSVRAPSGALGELGRPWLMVLHDPFLPRGTTTTDYLEAQRASNQGVARMEHVEAERSRRQGRPTYHVRDEFDVLSGGKKVRMSQESLLLIDAVEDRLHGYAVVLTMLGEDQKRLEATVDGILDSVRFADGD